MAKIDWIKAAYTLFAKQGPLGIKVEVLARLVGKSKSSFYYHFVDGDHLQNALLAYHQERIKILAKAESQCKNVIPDLIHTYIDYQEDLLFNRQLRVHRDKGAFTACIEQSDQATYEAILDIWSQWLGLEQNPELARLILQLTIDNFYLQLTEENFHYDWFVSYARRLKRMVHAFK